MNREVLINANNVSRYYGNHCAVNNVSFTISRGEVLGFLGPNGAGKSTLMQILCGVLAPTTGTITVAGHDIFNGDNTVKQQLGFLPEQPPVYDEMTVDDYLLFCGRIRGVPKNKLADALNNCKHRCGLAEVGRRLISNLSKGFKQRVGIAQAIIHAPSVIILDEPSSGLDPVQIVEVRKLIRELADNHGVILSTHILPEVQSTCNRVLIMNNGSIVLNEDLDSISGDRERLSLTIALHNPPTPEQITALPGVYTANHIGKHHFRISCNRNPEMVSTLADTAASRGWGLYEMIPETGSLEEVFIRLTHNDVTGMDILS